MPASKRPRAFLASLAFVAFLASLARGVHPVPAGRRARCILPITRLLMLGTALLLGALPARAQLACTPVAPGEVFLGNLAAPGKINPQDGTCWINNLRITSWDGTQLTAPPDAPCPAAVEMAGHATGLAYTHGVDQMGQARQLSDSNVF